MRNIKKIIIHCTATPRGRHVTVDEIRACHMKQNGWVDIGYHYIIYIDGSVHRGRDEERIGAHCLGQNVDSIGIAYVGGVELDGTPADTRTPEQKESLRQLVESLRHKYPGATVHGHNEFAAKACPSFNVKAEFGVVKMILIVMSLMTMVACGSVKKSSAVKNDFVEHIDMVKTEKAVATIDMAEFSDLVMTIDSIEIERFDSDCRLTKLKSGPVMVKMKRETAGRAVEASECGTMFDRDTATTIVSEAKKEVDNRGIKVWWLSIFIVISIIFITKMVKK